MTTVRWAERAGDSHASEDHVYVGERFAVVLDGASSPVPTQLTGGWLASVLGQEVHVRLCANPEAPLLEVAEASIASVAAAHELVPGAAPSTTLTIVRWSVEAVEVFVLGDSPAVVALADGSLEVVRDDRLRLVAATERLAFENAAARCGFAAKARGEWRALVAAERRARNCDGGYWIAEASPEAARKAKVRTWPIDWVTGILIVTDGVAAGPDKYGIPPTWAEALSIAHRDPADLVAVVHAAEEGDPSGHRWPRGKRHDDKAAVFVNLRLDR